MSPRAVWTLCLGPLLFYALGYAALTWPAMKTFSTHYLCDGGDGMQNVWNLWWIQQAFERGTNPWFTDQLFWPDGVTLLGQTLNPFNGFVAIPMQAFLSRVVAHNVLIVFGFAGAGWTCFLLARHLSGSYLGSLFAGAVFTFSHFHFAHAIGHMQLVSLEWMPLFVLAFVRLLESGGAWRGIGAALALLLVVLCDWYYAFYCVLLGAMLALGALLRRRGALFSAPHVAGMATFVLLGLATSGALAGMLVWTNHEDPLLFAHETERAGMDLLSPFVPSEMWRFSEWTERVWRRYDASLPKAETSSYFGTVAMLCGAWALWRSFRDRQKGVWAWFWIGAVFLALALGPRLHVYGKPHPQFVLPYSLLESALPPLKLSGLPHRMSIAAQLCVAVLAAHGFVPFLRQVVRSRLLWPLVIAAFVLETLPQPLPVTRLELGEVPAVVRRLADLPPGAVHGSSSDEGRKTYALYHQTLHGKPMTLGYVSREPTSLQAKKATLLGLEKDREFGRLMKDFAIRYLVRPADDSGPGLEPERTKIWSDGSHAIWVESHDALAGDARWQRALAGPHLELVRGDDGSSSIEIESPLDANRPFVLQVGRQVAPTLRWKWWDLGLVRDPELTRTVLGEEPSELGMVRYFDALGRARVRIAGPAFEADAALHFVAVTLAPGQLEPLRLGPVTALRR